MAFEPRIARAFERQAAGCRALGSPFTARLVEAIAATADETTAFGRRLSTWPDDPEADALALRAASALHALRLRGDATVEGVFPPAEVETPVLEAALRATARAKDRFLAARLDSPPQTNEVGRSAVLLGAHLHLAADTGLPVDLLEIGASAGLNLHFDRYRYALGEDGAARTAWGPTESAALLSCAWTGARPPLEAPIQVATRAGCDLRPLDPSDPHTQARLTAYVWADQPDRLRRLRAALEIAAESGVRPVEADAAAWLADQLARPARPGRVRVVQHSVMWTYLPEATRAEITRLLTRAGAAAAPDAPLAWLRMEGDDVRGSARIELTLWPQGETRTLGRADFHGRWARWDADARARAPAPDARR